MLFRIRLHQPTCYRDIELMMTKAALLVSAIFERKIRL
jgi:hypothetical protein